jgi:hypothetical protein
MEDWKKDNEWRADKRISEVRLRRKVSEIWRRFYWYNPFRAPVVQRIEQSTPKALMWVQFPPGAPEMKQQPESIDEMRGWLF